MNWNTPKKQEARRQTIIDYYRKIYNRKSIPKDRQYWTVCGQHYNKNGTFLEGTELDQVVSEGLITPNQFYGVDNGKEGKDIIDKNIISSNILYPTAHWLDGDIHNVMVNFSGHHEKYNPNKIPFNPSIIHLDLMYQPQTIFSEVLSIFLFVSELEIDEVMIVWNMILEYKYIERLKKNGEDIVDIMNEFGFGEIFYEYGWKFDYTIYMYPGYDKNRGTKMGVVNFYR